PMASGSAGPLVRPGRWERFEKLLATDDADCADLRGFGWGRGRHYALSAFFQWAVAGWLLSLWAGLGQIRVNPRNPRHPWQVFFAHSSRCTASASLRTSSGWWLT